MIQMLPDGTLVVRQRYENIEDNVVWDGIIEIKKDDPNYEKYLKQYEHDLEVINMQNDILGQDFKGTKLETTD